MTSSCQKVAELSNDKLKLFLNSFDCVMVDCDGVLWSGNHAIKGSPEAINKLRDKGKRVFYCTNNSTKTRAEYVEKCHQLGFGGNLEDIVGTSYLAAKYLSSHGFKGKVYVVGSTGVTQELENVGIQAVGIGPDPMPSDWSMAKASELVSDLDPSINCVIAAFDHHVSYVKITKAASILAKPGSIYIATNTDEQFPFGEDCIIPGTGAIVSSVTTASGRDPVIVGKPHPYMFDAVREEHPEIKPERTVMIGDRANTDILLGKNCGLQTLMVGTGCHKWTDIEKWSKSDDESQRRLVADFYVDKLGDIVDLINKI